MTLYTLMAIIYFLMICCLTFMVAKASENKERFLFFGLSFFTVMTTVTIIIQTIMENQ